MVFFSLTSPAHAAPFAYITNQFENTVSVIDTASHTVVATVAVGEGPFGVAVHPAGTFVYVTNGGLSTHGNTVSVIDTDTNTVTAVVTVGDDVRGVAVDPGGRFVYVTSLDNIDSVIDTGINAVVRTVPVGDGPVALGQFIGPEIVLTVAIDIKPGSFPNSINLKSKGAVPVAVLGSSNFNVQDVVVNTVVFAGASAVRSSFEDVDLDGDTDLVLHFRTQDLQLTSSSTEATLTGETIGGVPITGTDSVRIVP